MGLPKAEDFTAYNKVQTVARPPSNKPTQTPGTVETNVALVPAVVAFSAIATAAVPALLSPGQTAKDAQDAQRSKAGKAGRSSNAGRSPKAAGARKGGLFR